MAGTLREVLIVTLMVKKPMLSHPWIVVVKTVINLVRMKMESMNTLSHNWPWYERGFTPEILVRIDCETRNMCHYLVGGYAQ